jgi:hypothetical protein
MGNLVRRMTVIEHRSEYPLVASGGCSGRGIWDHIAAVRYVATQFASGLQSVMLTRMVPFAVIAFLYWRCQLPVTRLAT